MVENKKEKEFRNKILKILKAYQKVNGVKWNAQKIMDQISSEELHKMAETMFKTQTEYEKMKGGKKTRKKRKKRKNRTRRVQRGGQWAEYGIASVIYLCSGALIAWYVSNVFNAPDPPAQPTAQGRFPRQSGVLAHRELEEQHWRDAGFTPRQIQTRRRLRAEREYQERRDDVQPADGSSWVENFDAAFRRRLVPNEFVTRSHGELMAHQAEMEANEMEANNRNQYRNTPN
jgi:hypothetical protein